MTAEEVKGFLAFPEVDHTGLVRVKGKPKLTQERSCTLVGLLGLLTGLTEHDKVRLSPAGLVQLSGRTTGRS
jgi:hypothetical protein